MIRRWLSRRCASLSGISTSTVIRVPSPAGSRPHSKRRSETRQETITRAWSRWVSSSWAIGKSGYPSGYTVYSPPLVMLTVSIPAHQSGKRDGSYRCFQTSSGGAAEVVESWNDGTDLSLVDRLQFGSRPRHPPHRVV